jgi:hypothetical protein
MRVVVVRPRVISDDETDAELVVDGQRVIATNGVVELRQGRHLMTIRAPGCGSISRIVDVDGTGYALEDILVADHLVTRRRESLASLRAGDRAALVQLRNALGVEMIAAISADVGVLVARDGLSVTQLDVDVAATSAAIADAIVAATVPSDADELGADPSMPSTMWWVVGAAGVAAVVGGATLGAWLLWPGDAPPLPPRPVTVSCCGL